MNDAERKFRQCGIVPNEQYVKDMKAGAPLLCFRIAEVEYPFLDAKIGECTLCGEQIYYRAYNEIAINKICVQCQPLLEKARRA